MSQLCPLRYEAWLDTLDIPNIKEKLHGMSKIMTVENEIRADEIFDVNDQVLKDIGVSKVGERIRILKKINDLRGSIKETENHILSRIENLEKKEAEKEVAIASILVKINELYSRIEDLKQAENATKEKRKNSIQSLENSQRSSLNKSSKHIYRIYLDVENTNGFVCYKTISLDDNETVKDFLAHSMKKFKFTDPALCASYRLFLHWRQEEQLLEEKEYPSRVLETFKKFAKAEELYFVVRNVNSRLIHSQHIKASSKAIAILSYEATKADELNLYVGRLVLLLDRTDPNWWIVKDGDDVGWVPANHLITSKGNDIKILEEPCSVKIRENYAPLENNELIGTAGRVTHVIATCNSWALVECHGFYGWIPVDHLDDENSILMQKKRKSIKIITSMSLSNVARNDSNSSPGKITEGRRHSLLNFGEFLAKKANHLSRLISTEVIENTIPSAITEESGNRLIQIFEALNEMETMLRIETPKENNGANTVVTPVITPKEDNGMMNGNKVNHSVSFGSQADLVQQARQVTSSRPKSYTVSGSSPEKKTGKRWNDLLKEKFQRKMGDEAEKGQFLLTAPASTASSTSAGSSQSSGSFNLSQIKKCVKKKNSIVPSLSSHSLSKSKQDNTGSVQSHLDLNHQPTDSDFLLNGSELDASGSRKSSSTDVNRPVFSEVIPYEQLVELYFSKARNDLVYEKIERYLSNTDCYEHLGFCKSDLDYLPQWKIDERKEKAFLL